MSRWRTFMALPGAERRLLLGAAARLLVARLLLSTFGMGRTRRWLASSGENVDHPTAERLARAVERIARHVPVQTNCLDRAIALWWLLSSRGLAADLRIGVRKNEDASLGAHAWVEHDRIVLLDDDASHYLPLDPPMLASGGR